VKLVHAARRVLHSLGAFRLMHRWLVPGKVSVLMYHGLVKEPLPVRDWCFLSLDRFEEQMRYLTAHFEVVHVEEALAPGRAESARRPLACVTFDDGFASVHGLAFPVLERLRIPATVYLVTDLLDSSDTVWFARLHQALCETSATEVHLAGRVFALGGVDARARASAALQVELKKFDRPSFGAVFEDVLGQLGFGGDRRAMPWDAFRMLTSDEVRLMSRRGLVRFGGHTAGHQILTRTTREDARAEIERSVRRVAALVDSPSRSFAYPNGGPRDFDPAVAAMVREAGIDYAVTTIDGPNDAGRDPFCILRYGIGSADPLDRFAGLAHHFRESLAVVGRGFRRKSWLRADRSAGSGLCL
jgi:peptidoglycan/xylan/chitin deacetylase (PgdA/CDA1 family)